MFSEVLLRNSQTSTRRHRLRDSLISICLFFLDVIILCCSPRKRIVARHLDGDSPAWPERLLAHLKVASTSKVRQMTKDYPGNSNDGMVQVGGRLAQKATEELCSSSLASPAFGTLAQKSKIINLSSLHEALQLSCLHRGVMHVFPRKHVPRSRGTVVIVLYFLGQLSISMAFDCFHLIPVIASSSCV